MDDQSIDWWSYDKECAGLIGNVLSIHLDKIWVRFPVSTLMEEMLGTKDEKPPAQCMDVKMKKNIYNT